MKDMTSMAPVKTVGFVFSINVLSGALPGAVNFPDLSDLQGYVSKYDASWFYLLLGWS